MSLIYEQLEEEGARAFAAFVLYRDSGSGRSLEAVSQQTEKNMSLIRRWSSEYSWVARCRAWDMEQDRIRRDAHLKSVAEMADRHAKIAMRLQEKVIQRLKELDPMELSPREISAWIDTAVKIERLSRGVNTDSVKQEITGANGGAVDVVVSTIPTPEELSEVINTLVQAGVVSEYNNPRND